MPNVNYRGNRSQDPKTHTDLTGFTAAPNHYSQHGRETIDKARDMKTDAEFAAFCDLTAFIYRDRAPYKGAEEQDIAKAVWYEAMADHVRYPSYWEDPRSKRPDFVPYHRQPVEIPAQQDPNVPPESGVTSIPLGAPWPPLSREQVVQLHEALIEFLKAPMVAPNRLAMKLLDLGIGSPPPTRTWTHEEVAKVAEEVQQRSGLPRHAEGRAPTTATELAILESMGWKSPADEPRRQEGQWEEPPKRNCWTCDHDKVFGGGTAHICTALPPRRAKGTGDSPTVKAISAWTDSQTLDASLMPPKDSDGCPGWEPKP